MSTEKTSLGASLHPKPMTPTLSSDPHTSHTPAKDNLSVQDAPVTPLSTASIRTREPANPFDNFYDEEERKTMSSVKTPAHSHITDVESQREFDLSRTKSSRSLEKVDSVWPSRRQQKAQAKKAKKARSWNPMAGMDKKKKTIFSIIIALFVIGAAVGVGVGVSKAVGGGVTTIHGGSKPIGSGDGQTSH